MLSIEVKVDGALFRAGDTSKIVGDELNAAMHASTQHLRGLIIPKTPVGVSGLLRKTQASVTGEARSIEGRVFNPAPYGIVVEMGRTPGAKPPRSSDLELWVRRKLDVPENKVKSVAFLVARKIGKQGTKAVKMFASSVEEGRGTINHLFDRAAARIIARLS